METLKKIANMILEDAKAQGIDFAACMVSESETQEINIAAGEFSLMRTLFNKDISLSVYKDNKKGSVAMTGFDEDKIHGLVLDACAAAESSEPDEAWEIDQSGRHEKFTAGVLQGDLDKLFERTKELVDDIKKDYPKILIEEGLSEYTRGKSVYANTFGTMYEVEKGNYEYELMFSGHEGDEGSSFNAAGIETVDLDTPFIDRGTIRRDLADTEKQIHTESVDEKFVGTAVFTPDCLGQLVFGTVLGFTSERALIDGTSPWADKLGQKVCDERITLSLAPHDERVVCGANFTGEGYLTEDFDLIKDGVLNSFCIGQYGANKLGQKRSGNTTYNGIVKPGDKSLDEIIAGIDKGIVFGRFSGGSPAPSGEFSGVAKNSFLIENGKITKALSETMVSGNLTDMLFKLVDISSEVKEDGSTSVPYMAFDGLTISGK
ncbi:MAG: TldD/PmbA family protein [Firmicutes bacterium]|nr:TldD/PmbA family protein [Bacillota bacterium]